MFGKTSLLLLQPAAGSEKSSEKSRVVSPLGRNQTKKKVVPLEQILVNLLDLELRISNKQDRFSENKIEHFFGATIATNKTKHVCSQSVPNESEPEVSGSGVLRLDAAAAGCSQVRECACVADFEC